MNNAISKPKVEGIQFAEAHHIGYGQQRQSWEDRCAAYQMKTAAGMELVIGIVADGIGGANAGEVASQLAVDKILDFLKSSTDTDPNQLLYNAVHKAHASVVKSARTNVNLRAMGSTVTVAAIHQGKLYLAHLGDSRAYFVREGHIIQLTIDHTWGNEKVRLGQLSLQQASVHARKDELSRYLGQPGEIEVDVGLRVDGEADPSKSVLSGGGLELLPGDSVVLCTDGLVKERPGSNEHFVEPAEIVNIIHKNEPQDSANTLVALALGRQVDDNVSVVILEAPGKKKSFAAPQKSRLPVVPALAGLVVIILLALILILVINRPDEPDVISANPPTVTMSSEIIRTTTPTATMMPSLGFIEVVEAKGLSNVDIPGQASFALTAGERIPISKDVRLWTTSGTVKLRLEDGSIIYVGQNTTLYPNWVATMSAGRDQTELTLEKGEVFAIAESLLFRSKSGDFQAVMFNAKMGIIYDPPLGKFVVDCLEGACQVNKGSDLVNLKAGRQGGFKEGLKLPEYGAQYDMWRDLGGNDVPAPTPTPTMTSTSTASPTPTVTETRENAPTIKPTEKPGGGSSPQPPKPPTPTEPPPTEAPPVDTPLPP